MVRFYTYIKSTEQQPTASISDNSVQLPRHTKDIASESRSGTVLSSVTPEEQEELDEKHIDEKA